MVQSDISGSIDPIWLKFVLLSELWPRMATKKFQPDQINSSGEMAVDHNGTCGLERRYIWTRTAKDFPPFKKSINIPRIKEDSNPIQHKFSMNEELHPFSNNNL